MLRRQCTAEFKIKPLVKKQRELLGVGYGQHVPKTQHVEAWIGISQDEIGRISEPYRLKWATNYYPLIERGMSRAHCLNWMERRGYPRPPKSACLGCPFKDNRAWREMKIERPGEFADVVKFDGLIRSGLMGVECDAFVHSSLLPMGEVDFRNAEDMGQLQFDGFQSECAGMCGV